jgi:hypothetical protein
MWKILEIEADADLITGARYFCVRNNVETEGWWRFAEPKLTVPFADVTEEMVLDWVKVEIGEQVEARLDAQAQAQSKVVVAPWLPQVFTPEL